MTEADLGDERYDRVYAVNVGAFARGDPGAELGVVRERLAPGGGLWLFVQAPADWRTAAAAEALAARVARHGFAVEDVRHAELAGHRVSCVHARPA